MAGREVFPIINCAGLAGTRRWYERVLSAVVDYRFPEDGDPEYLTLRVGAGAGTAPPARRGESPGRVPRAAGVRAQRASSWLTRAACRVRWSRSARLVASRAASAYSRAAVGRSPSFSWR